MSEDSQDDKTDFCEGLARIFSAIKAHLSSYVISAPLAYHLVTKETRFEFSHEFVYLLLAQMEDHIDGKNISFKIKRKKKGNDGNDVDQWIDCFTYNNEDLILELRLNTLDKFVDKFVVIEATTDHAGNNKELNFDMN